MEEIVRQKRNLDTPKGRGLTTIVDNSSQWLGVSPSVKME